MALDFFLFVFLVIVVYIIAGNYLYFAKVLRTLDESPRMMPFGQLDQVDRYLQTLDNEQKQAWSARVLGNVRAITAIVMVLVLSMFAVTLISQ